MKNPGGSTGDPVLQYQYRKHFVCRSCCICFTDPLSNPHTCKYSYWTFLIGKDTETQVRCCPMLDSTHLANLHKTTRCKSEQSQCSPLMASVTLLWNPNVSAWPRDLIPPLWKRRASLLVQIRALLGERRERDFIDNMRYRPGGRHSSSSSGCGFVGKGSSPYELAYM